jgi:hypothetical protein
MSLFDSKLQRVFVRENEGRTHFETQLLDDSWTEIVFHNNGDFDVKFHNQNHEPQGEEVQDIFRNDSRVQSALVRHLFTASMNARNEMQTKLMEALNLLQLFRYRLEDPSDEPSGYTDPISPIPQKSGSLKPRGK